MAGHRDEADTAGSPESQAPAKTVITVEPDFVVVGGVRIPRRR